MKKVFLLLFFVLISSFTFATDPQDFPTPSLFPLPRAYESNVEFWMKVYGEWEENKMAIHDSSRMEIIFEVVEIPEENELLQTMAKNQLRNRVDEIKKILIELDNNPESRKRSQDHQKIYDLYSHVTAPGKFREAASNIRIQQGIKERFHRGLEQMTMHIDQLKRVMREEGLPEEIAYLPLVESSFNNQSLSKTRAAGIWQFMPGTARHYMKVNSDVDERLDPATATRGAARYLKRSYQLFGNWPVSLMSYNHGQQGMANAAKALGTKDFMSIVQNYSGKYFGFASRNFYAEFLAAYKVMRDADKYFKEVNYQPPLKYDSVRLAKPLYISAIQKYSSLTREDIRTYNPALQSSVLFSRRPIPAGYNLHLPAGKYSDPAGFIANLRSGQPAGEKPSSSKTATVASAKPPASSTTTSKRASSSKTYTVKRGDTLFSISRKFSMSVNALRELNDLSHNIIHPGQRLFVKF